MLNDFWLPEFCSSIRVIRKIKIPVDNLGEHYTLNDFCQLRFGAPILQFKTLRSQIATLIEVEMGNEST
jgi:hypothetical protein